MPKKMNPLIHFGLCNGNRSSPMVRFFTPDGVEVELRQAAREFFQDSGIEIDFAKHTVYLSRIFKWYIYIYVFNTLDFFCSFRKFYCFLLWQNLYLPLKIRTTSIKHENFSVFLRKILKQPFWILSGTVLILDKIKSRFSIGSWTTWIQPKPAFCHTCSMTAGPSVYLTRILIGPWTVKMVDMKAAFLFKNWYCFRT